MKLKTAIRAIQNRSIRLGTVFDMLVQRDAMFVSEIESQAGFARPLYGRRFDEQEAARAGILRIDLINGGVWIGGIGMAGIDSETGIRVG